MSLVNRPLQKKAVELEFAAHSRGQNYSKRGVAMPKTKTILYEDPGADKLKKTDYDIRPTSSFNYYETEKRYMLDAFERGITILSGEKTGSTEPYEEYFMMEKNPTLSNIKTYYLRYALLDRKRHAEIIERIKESEKPLEARYGTLHSLLSAQLLKHNVKSHREMDQIVFDWENSCIRKLILGQKVSDIHYKRAFVCQMLNKIWRSHIDLLKITDKEVRFWNLINFLLVGRLSESQLNSILKTKKYTLIFEYNHLPESPNRTQLIEFVEKYEGYFRRYVPEYKPE